MTFLTRRTFAIFSAGVAALSLVVASVNALDDSDDGKEGEEREISLKEAPEAIQKAFADVKVHEVEVETKKGMTIYGVSLMIGETEVELELSKNGTLIKVEVETEDDGDEEDDDDSDNDDD